MECQQTTKFVNFGWGENGLPSLRCRARLVPPPKLLTTCCFPWFSQEQKQGKWWSADVSLELRSSTESKMMLRCRSVEGNKEIHFPLLLVSGLCRLRMENEIAPGLELRMGVHMLRLQLLGVPSGHSEQASQQTYTSWQRLRLFHAFLAATAEFYNEKFVAQLRN